MTSPRTLAETVAAEVRAEMGRQRMSTASLAQALNVSHMYLSRRLGLPRDDQPIPLDLADLEGIAKALDVPVSQLLPAEQPASAS
jgi:transcriptional regulator with XRE-family HTH domain